MSEAMQSTVELNTTMAAKGELYGDASEGCRDCESREFLLVEVNGARGNRKYMQVCYDCSEHLREAPGGVYDPTVLGYTDGADYNGF